MASESASVRVRAELDSRPAEKALDRFIKKAESADLRLNLKEKNFTQPLGRITGAANEFNKSLAASNARVIAFAASAGLMYSVQRALVSVTKSAIEVEAALADINVILGASSANLAKFGDQLFKIAGQTGQAFQTVTVAATELARQGLSMEETLRRTKDAMILTRLAGMDAASAVDALTASINSFNKAAITSTEIVNKMATVDAAFAVSTNDLADALKRVGSSAIDAGVSFDQLMAMTTAVQQITARGGAVIGNSLKSIFTRIQRTEVLDQLGQLGVVVRDMKGNTLPAIQIMTQLAKTIDSLSSAQRANITELMGGVFQINVVKAALSDLGKEYSIYDNALKTSAAATDQAVKRNEQLNQTLQSLVNKTFQNVKKAGAEIGKLTIAPALEGVLDKVNSALEKFDSKDSESTGNKIGKGILEGIGNFIKGPGLVIGLAVVGKLLQNFGKFASDSFKEFFNINEAAKKRLAMEKFINTELSQNEALTKSILSGELSVADAEKVILKGLEARVLQQEKLNRLIKEASFGLSRKGAYASLADEATGTYSVKPPKRFKGNIPNFSQTDVASLVKEELSSASYAKSGTKAVIDNLPGLGLHVRNTAEEVAYAPGMKAPFINPPPKSPEGREHRRKAIEKTGIDPYELGSSSGLPGFAKKAKTPKTKTLRSSNQSKGVLLPEFGRNDSNLTFEASLAKVYPSPKSTERKKWENKGFTNFRMTGVKAGRLREKASSSFDSLLDSSFDPAIQGLGASIVGTNKGKLPKKSTGKFSDYFDKKAWPQVKGRLFEAALNYVAVNMSAKAQMGSRLDDIKSLTGGETWDFPDIKNQLASLYKINTGGNWDAKSNVDGGTQASIIKKTLTTKYKGKTIPSRSSGHIPGFAPPVMGLNLQEARMGIEQFKSGKTNQAQGLVSKINASKSLTALQKNTLKGEINEIRARRKNSKNPRGLTIDGTGLASMLVPQVGGSKGEGIAKPKIDADNTLLRKYLSRHYLDKTGVDFDKLPENKKSKVINSTKASFPILGPSKGTNVNIVGDMATAVENETRNFVASMKGGAEASKANVKENLSTHESSISSAAGAVFESGIKSAFDLEVGKTNDRFDATTSKGLKEAFPIKTPYGEFKIADNSPLRQDMAAKILRQKIQAGTASEGLIPNFLKYQIGQKLPKGRGAGGRHLAVRDQNMGIHYDPTAMFHADLVKKSNLMGKTMDGGWLFPNGRYEKIPGHDGSGLQSGGFIPSFAALGGFVPGYGKKDVNRAREAKQADVPYSQTYVSFVDTAKYAGPVVGNRKDEPTYQALKNAVRSHPDPQNAGLHGSGFIPSFSPASGTPGKGGSPAFTQLGADDISGEKLKAQLNEYKNKLELTAKGLGGATAEQQAIITLIDEQIALLNNYKSSQRDLNSKTETNSEEAKALEEKRQAGAENLIKQRQEANASGEEFNSRVGEHNALQAQGEILAGEAVRLQDKLNAAEEAHNSKEEERIRKLQEGAQGATQNVGATQAAVDKGRRDAEKTFSTHPNATHRVEDPSKAAMDLLKNTRDPDGTRSFGGKGQETGHAYKDASLILGGGGKKKPGQFDVTRGQDAEKLLQTLSDQRGQALRGQVESARRIQKQFLADAKAAGARGIDLKVLEQITDKEIQQAEEIYQTGEKELKSARAAEAKAKAKASKEGKKKEFQADEGVKEQIKANRSKTKELVEAKDAAHDSAVQAAAHAKTEGNALDEMEAEQQKTIRLLEEKNKLLEQQNNALGAGGPEDQIRANLEGATGTASTAEDQISTQRGKALHGKRGVLAAFGMDSELNALKKARGDRAAQQALGLDSEDALESLINQGQAEGSEALQSKAMLAAMALPMATSMIAQNFDENTEEGAGKKAIAEGVGEIGSFASMGAMFGPWGAAAGAAAGAMSAGIKIMDAWENKTFKFNATAEQAAEKLTLWNNASQNYLKSLTEFNDAMSSKSGVVDPQRLTKIKNSLSEALINVPSEFRSRLATARGDVEKIQKIFGEIQQDLQREAKVTAANAEIAEKVEEGSSGFSNRIGLAGRSDDVNMFVGKSSENDQRKVFNMIKSTIDLTKFYGEEGERLAKKIRKTAKNAGSDFNAFKNALDEAGVDTGTMELITDMYEGGKKNVIALSDEFENFGFNAQYASKTGEKLTSSILNFRSEMDQITAAQDRFSKAAAKSRDLVQQLASSLVDRLKHVNQMADQRSANSRAMSLTDIKGRQQVAQPFIDSVTKSDMAGQVQIASLQSKQLGALEKLDSSIKVNLVKTLHDAFSKLTSKTEKATETSSKEQQENMDSLKKQENALDAYTETLTKSANLASDDGKTFNEINDGIQEIVSSSGLGEGAQQALQDDLAQILDQGNMSVAQLVDQQKFEMDQARLNNHYQAIIAENTKQIGQLGGIGDFMGGQSPGMDKMNKMFRDAALSGSRMDAGMESSRSSMNILDLARNFGGLSGGALPSSMRDMAVEGVRQDLERKLGRMERGMESTGMAGPDFTKEIEELRGKLGEIAETKVAAQLKDVPTHLQTISEKIGHLTEKTLGDASMQESVKSALVAVMGSGSSFIADPLNRIEGLLAFEKGVKQIKQAQGNLVQALEERQVSGAQMGESFDAMANAAMALTKHVPEAILKTAGLLTADQVYAMQNPEEGRTGPETLEQAGLLKKQILALNKTQYARKLYDTDKGGAAMGLGFGGGKDQVANTYTSKIIGGSLGRGYDITPESALGEAFKKLRAESIRSQNVVENRGEDGGWRTGVPGRIMADEQTSLRNAPANQIGAAVAGAMEENRTGQGFFENAESMPSGGQIWLAAGELYEHISKQIAAGKTVDINRIMTEMYKSRKGEGVFAEGSQMKWFEAKLENLEPVAQGSARRDLINSTLMAAAELASRDKKIDYSEGAAEKTAKDMRLGVGGGSADAQNVTAQAGDLINAVRGNLAGMKAVKPVEAWKMHEQLAPLVNRWEEAESRYQKADAASAKLINAVMGGMSSDAANRYRDVLEGERGEGRSIIGGTLTAGGAQNVAAGKGALISEYLEASGDETKIDAAIDKAFAGSTHKDVEEHKRLVKSQLFEHKKVLSLLEQTGRIYKQKLAIEKKTKDDAALIQKAKDGEKAAQKSLLKQTMDRAKFKGEVGSMSWADLDKLSAEGLEQQRIRQGDKFDATKWDVVDKEMAARRREEGSMFFGDQRLAAQRSTGFKTQEFYKSMGLLHQVDSKRHEGGKRTELGLRKGDKDTFQMFDPANTAMLDDKAIADQLAAQYGTVGTAEGVDAAKKKFNEVLLKVQKGRAAAFKEFVETDMTWEQYAARLKEAELEVVRSRVASGKISFADAASKIKAQVNLNVSKGMDVTTLFADYLSHLMRSNSKDRDAVARNIAESMAKGMMGHKDGAPVSAQLLQGKAAGIMKHVEGLKLGKSQETAYANALGNFQTFQHNFTQGIGGRAEHLAALNTKLQAALKDTRGKDGEIDKAYNEYIAALSTGLKAQDKITQRKGIMDSTGKRVGRDQVGELDQSVKEIVDKYEGQAVRGEITEEGRTALQNAEAALKATTLANKKDLVSTAAMTTARLNFLNALTKHSSDQDATKAAYDEYARSVAAAFKSQDLTSISARTVGQFGQEAMGGTSATFGADIQAITARYNAAFGKGEISKGGVERLTKADAELRVARSKADAGVGTAEKLTGAYLKFLNAISGETSNMNEVMYAYEDFVRSIVGADGQGKKLNVADWFGTTSKLIQGQKGGSTRSNQQGLIEEIENITDTNQSLYNSNQLTKEGMDALNKAESSYFRAEQNWASGLLSTSALIESASKDLTAAIASGNVDKIQTALTEYMLNLDVMLNPQDFLERGSKFLKANVNKVAKGGRSGFSNELLDISDLYQDVVDNGELTEKDGQTISSALADYGAAQKNFKDGLISQAQLMKSAEAQLTKISATAGDIEIRGAMKAYISAAKAPIDTLSALQETGKDLASLGGGVLAKDLEGFKGSLQGINSSYDTAVNEGKVTRKNAKTLKKSAKDFTIAQSSFSNGMLGSADFINAAKKRLNDELKVNGPKTEEALTNYLNAIDKATQPLDKKQFRIGQITKFAEELSSKERKKFRTSLGGEDFASLDAARDRGDISRKEAKGMKNSLAVIRKLEAENAPAEELRKAWDDYYNLRRKAFDNETEFLKSLNQFYKNPEEVGGMMDQQRRRIVNDSRGDFQNAEQAKKFNTGLINYQNELKTIARERSLTENELAEALKAEADYQKMIIKFNQGKVGSRERMAGADAAMRSKRAAGADTADDFIKALQARFSYGQNETVHAVEDMVLSMVDSFESNLNDALYNAISGAKDVKEAFKDMADAMLNEITKMTIQATTRAVIGSLGIPGMARGGLVTGGSGVKDDVPTLLQGGEFVIKKTSVDKFGSGFFKALNSSSAAKFSSGGSAQLVNSYGMKQNEPGGIEVHRVEVNPANDPQGGLTSSSYAGGKGAGFTLRNAFVYNDDKRPTGGGLEVDSRMSRRALMDSDNPRNKIRMDKEKALFDYTQQKIQDMDNYQKEYQDYLDKKKARWRMAGYNAAMQLGLNVFGGGGNRSYTDTGADQNEGGKSLWSWFGKKDNSLGSSNNPRSGGPTTNVGAPSSTPPPVSPNNFQLDTPPEPELFKNFASGGLSADTIPAMLTSGEYIMNREAVQKYGIETMNKLNRGQAQGFAQGGLVGAGPLDNGSPRGSGGSSTNNVNITVNVDNKGNIDSQATSRENTGGSERAQGREMAREIEGAVMKVLVEQQKQGGVLRKLR